MNKTILIGRLTKDIDLRKTPNGASVVQFTIAVNRRVKQQGQPEADFINCVAWNKTADVMAQYLHKGSQIGVEGRIQTRSYDDKDGKRIYVTEVIVEAFDFLESRGNGQSQQNESQQQYNANVNTNVNESQVVFEDGYTLDLSSDDLPF